MRLKFKQGGTDAVIAVTNVHYCKHKVKVFDNKPDDEVDEFGNTYRCGLLVSQQGMDENAVIVEDMSDADICVLQDGWTRSKTCVEEYRQAEKVHICVQESYLYTDRLVAHVS